MEDFLKLKVDHRTVLVRNMDVFRTVREFLVSTGYTKVYEVERIGEEKTAMTTFACKHPVTSECIAVVYGINATDEPSHAHAPFDYGAKSELIIYIQHLALRTSDIFELRRYLEGKGARFLTPIFEEKDSFGPLIQCFTRDLFDDEWFFFEFVQRDYRPEDIKWKAGELFVSKTVRSLYNTKQEEFREWLKTSRKITMFDSTKAKEEIMMLLENLEPKDVARTIPALARLY